MPVRIALIGGTGLVGAALAPRLAAAGHDLHCLQRRSGGTAGTMHAADPNAWPAIVADLRPDAAISALGTTMRKAGSEEAFRAVDLDMVLAFARAARAAGASRMIAISSVGADRRAKAFYLRIKGEMEAALADLGFDRLDLVRPGLLRGERGADRRFGERLGIALSPIVNLALQGPLDRFAAIDAATVAKAIACSLAQEDGGPHILHNREIRRLACA
jgi:uncharacterized protein YbjT (DUF2867 family)